VEDSILKSMATVDVDHNETFDLEEFTNLLKKLHVSANGRQANAMLKRYRTCKSVSQDEVLKFVKEVFYNPEVGRIFHLYLRH
jgi:replication initiation and membrane attachment protein DnaB